MEKRREGTLKLNKDNLGEFEKGMLGATPKSTGIAAVDKEIAKVDAAVFGPKGSTSESMKLKKKMLFGEKSTTKEKLPDHIRKAYIIINDKKKNNPIEIKFSGVWTGSDINLAGKHLILDYQVYVRNRAIRGK